VDLPARKVFVTTASAIQFDDGLAYCIVRVSLDGLSIEDSWRVDPGNVEDADWGSSPTLFVDGDGRRLVGAGQKDGFYYAFLRDDLAQGPVWRTPLARGGSCPQCCDGTLSTAAFDGLRLYAGAGAPPGADPARAVGTVSALDPTTGDILWTYTIEGGPVIAPITFVNGVVFAAGAFKVVALSSATGEELWSSPAPAGFYGGVAVANGKVFVGDTYGNLYAFGFSPEPPPVVRTGQNR
jgi:polyvinyl alcohol dehydrogenase (cytochrome)